MRGLPINIGGLSIWVHGYEFPNSREYWDSNWLLIDAKCEDVSKSARIIRDPCLRTEELAGFRDDLKLLQSRDGKTASLNPMEPYLEIEITSDALKGRLSISVGIVSDHSLDRSIFLFERDLSDSNRWIAEIDAVLKAFPTKDGV